MEKPEKPSVRFLVPDSANSSTTETVTNVVVSTTITKSPRSSPRKRPAVFSLVSLKSSASQPFSIQVEATIIQLKYSNHPNTEYLTLNI